MLINQFEDLQTRNVIPSCLKTKVYFIILWIKNEKINTDADNIRWSYIYKYKILFCVLYRLFISILLHYSILNLILFYIRCELHLNENGLLNGIKEHSSMKMSGVKPHCCYFTPSELLLAFYLMWCWLSFHTLCY